MNALSQEVWSHVSEEGECPFCEEDMESRLDFNVHIYQDGCEVYEEDKSDKDLDKYRSLMDIHEEVLDKIEARVGQKKSQVPHASDYKRESLRNEVVSKSYEAIEDVLRPIMANGETKVSVKDAWVVDLKEAEWTVEDMLSPSEDDYVLTIHWSVPSDDDNDNMVQVI